MLHSDGMTSPFNFSPLCQLVHWKPIKRHVGSLKDSDCTDLCRCCNCANTKETKELEDNCPDSEDCVSLILINVIPYSVLYSFIFHISYYSYKDCFSGSLVLFSFVEKWMNGMLQQRQVCATQSCKITGTSACLTGTFAAAVYHMQNTVRGRISGHPGDVQGPIL